MVSFASLFRQTGYLGITGYENKMDMGIGKSNEGFGYPSDRVDEFAFYELQIEVSVFNLNLTVQTFIPLTFPFENGANVISVEPFSSGRLVSILIQPDRNILQPHTTVLEVLDGIVKELLIVGIGCNEKVASLQNHIETEEHIHIIRG